MPPKLALFPRSCMYPFNPAYPFVLAFPLQTLSHGSSHGLVCVDGSLPQKSYPLTVFSEEIARSPG